jgi:hypothetical protein
MNCSEYVRLSPVLLFRRKGTTLDVAIVFGQNGAGMTFGIALKAEYRAFHQRSSRSNQSSNKGET